MNIQPIQGALGLIQRLRGVRFNWKKDGKEDIGLVAEEVGEVVPEIVTYEKNGHDAQSLDYSRLVPVTIEAIKEQQKTIGQQRGEIQQLRTENNILRDRVEQQQQTIETMHEEIKAIQRTTKMHDGGCGC